VRLLKTLASLLLLVSGAVAQHPVGSLLTIVTEHQTAYRRDVTDYSLLAWIPIERWLPNQRRARSRICAPIPDR
jgi:hypothetical protein